MKCAECGCELHREEARICAYCEDFGRTRFPGHLGAGSNVDGSVTAKQPTSPPPGSHKPEPPPSPPAKTEALWTPEIARETRAFHVELIEAARTLGLLLDPTATPVTTPYQALGVVKSAGMRLRTHVVRGQDPDIAPNVPAPSGEAIVAAARAFVRAWAETGRGSVLLPECVEGHAFDLVRAVHAAYPPASDPYGPSAPKPDDPPDLTRLWNDAEAIYEAEFPRPRHYFGMLPTLAKVAYFERAALDAIDRTAGSPTTIRARVVSVEEMKRYLHAAVPTEITGG